MVRFLLFSWCFNRHICQYSFTFSFLTLLSEARARTGCCVFLCVSLILTSLSSDRLKLLFQTSKIKRKHTQTQLLNSLKPDKLNLIYDTKRIINLYSDEQDRPTTEYRLCAFLHELMHTQYLYYIKSKCLF